jgi:hypothetical protein
MRNVLFKCSRPGHVKSTSSSYLIIVSFPIFRENFMKNIKKPPTTYTLYLDEGVGNE